VIKDSTQIAVFLLFMEVIQLVVAESNKYYSQYLDIFDNDNKCFQLPDVTIH
jgi:hypothetical protein